MNCSKCGSVLPQGAQFCSVCNEPVSPVGYTAYGGPQNYPQGYSQPQSFTQPANYTGPGAVPPGYTQQAGQSYPQSPAQPYQPPQSFPQQQGYGPGNPQQGYPQGTQGYGQQSYPQGYSQISGGYYGAQPSAKREPGALLNALMQIPRMFVQSFRDPGAVLTGMMERRDVFTAPVIAGFALLLTFLCAVVVTRGMVGVYFQLLSTTTGASLASDASSLNQGISYIAGRIGAPVGGIAALCQLFAMIFPTGVAMVYLCAICKLRFSVELLCGFVTITTLPTLAASLLAMVFSLLSPALALVFCVSGMIVSYVMLCALLARMTGKTDAQLVIPKILCVTISVFLTLLFLLFVGGALLGGVLTTMFSLTSSLGSLV